MALMPLSWNEVRHRAITFSKEWKGETREEAEAKSFWDGFFNVFGIFRRSVASFEEPVKNLRGGEKPICVDPEDPITNQTSDSLMHLLLSPRKIIHL